MAIYDVKQCHRGILYGRVYARNASLFPRLPLSTLLLLPHRCRLAPLDRSPIFEPIFPRDAILTNVRKISKWQKYNPFWAKYGGENGRWHQTIRAIGPTRRHHAHTKSCSHEAMKYVATCAANMHRTHSLILFRRLFSYSAAV